MAIGHRRANRSRPVRAGRLLAGTVRPRRGYRRRPLFRDPAVQRDLFVAGYHVTDVIVPPDAIRSLIRGSEEWREMAPPAGDSRFYHSGARPPTPATEVARGHILRHLVPHVEQMIDTDRARVSPAVFQMKPSGPDSGIRSHQDPFIVDESRAFSVSAWTALTDVDVDSGPMIVLPGSHRFARWHRVATTTDDLDGYHEVIERHARMIILRPGQVLLFDSALIHGSLVNRSGSLRIGASSTIVPSHLPITAPAPCPEGPPETAQVYRLHVDEVTGRVSPRLEDAVPIHTMRVDSLVASPRALAATCRLNAWIRSDAGGAPIPPCTSTA